MLLTSLDATHHTHMHTHTHTHTFWQECSNSYIPHTGFHSHYDSTVLHRTTRDTQVVLAQVNHASRGVKKNLLHMKTKRHYFPNESCVRQNWVEVNDLSHGPSHFITRERAIGTHLIWGWVALQSGWTFFWKIHKSVAPPSIPNPDHPALNIVTIVTTLSWLLTKMKK